MRKKYIGEGPWQNILGKGSRYRLYDSASPSVVWIPLLIQIDMILILL